jgi:predicted dienelactone hydrolase
MTLRSITRTAVAALVMAVMLTIVGTTPASATEFRRGPDPTNNSLLAVAGPFAISTIGVSNAATPGFGAADIYYPTSNAEGTLGGVAVAPGFTATRSSMEWLARRIASHGFVVININTNSTFDQPASRGTQLLAALDYLRNNSAVNARVDDNRLAVVGHSMGGGGTLEAAESRSTLQAAIPLTGWNTDKDFSTIRTPTLVVGAESDTVAPVSSHSIPFYTSMSASLDKAYLELNNASHFAPNSRNDTIGKYSVAWLKRFVDNDTRYETFLCNRPAESAISAYRDTCPHSTPPD